MIRLAAIVFSIVVAISAVFVDREDGLDCVEKSVASGLVQSLTCHLGQLVPGDTKEVVYVTYRRAAAAFRLEDGRP